MLNVSKTNKKHFGEKCKNTSCLFRLKYARARTHTLVHRTEYDPVIKGHHQDFVAHRREKKKAFHEARIWQ